MQLKILLLLLFLTYTLTSQATTILFNSTPQLTRTLILTDNEAVYATHSIFFEDLRNNQHTLTLKFLDAESIISKKLTLMEDGVYVYDNIILMTTSLEDLTSSPVFNLQDFFDKGGNIFFIGDYDISESFKR